MIFNLPSPDKFKRVVHFDLDAYAEYYDENNRLIAKLYRPEHENSFGMPGHADWILECREKVQAFNAQSEEIAEYHKTNKQARRVLRSDLVWSYNSVSEQEEPAHKLSRYWPSSG